MWNHGTSWISPHLTKETDDIGIFLSLAGDIVKADASVLIFGLWCPVRKIPDSLPCWVFCDVPLPVKTGGPEFKLNCKPQFYRQVKLKPPQISPKHIEVCIISSSFWMFLVLGPRMDATGCQTPSQSMTSPSQRAAPGAPGASAHTLQPRSGHSTAGAKPGASGRGWWLFAMGTNVHIIHVHLYNFIYNMAQLARAQALASLCSQAPVFSGISNQDSFSAISASRTIQAASIFYFDNLLATTSALYRRSCLLFWLHFFYIDVFSSHYFLHFVVFNSFLKAVGEALHSLFYISFSGFAGASANSSISYLVKLCLVSVALFSCLQFQPIFINFLLHRHFLHAHFPEKKTKGEVFHIKSYSSLSSFAGMCAHRHSVLKGPWQFPFPVLAGLKVPVYKVKFVIRTFLPTTEAVIISSGHAMPHHRWRIFIKLSPLQF